MAARFSGRPDARRGCGDREPEVLLGALGYAISRDPRFTRVHGHRLPRLSKTSLRSSCRATPPTAASPRCRWRSRAPLALAVASVTSAQPGGLARGRSAGGRVRARSRRRRSVVRGHEARLRALRTAASSRRTRSLSRRCRRWATGAPARAARSRDRRRSGLRTAARRGDVRCSTRRRG